MLPSDDKVEGLRLSSAFDITCRAWKERFKVQYTHCGCPIPGDSIGERLSKLIKLYSPPPHLPFDRPLSAAHPSDHNAARFIPPPRRAGLINLSRYITMAFKKRKEASNSSKKPVKLPPQGPGSSPPGHSSSAHLQRSTFTHDTTPFLVPIPTSFAPGAVIGAAVCVADGHALQPAGGCDSVSLYFIHEVYFLTQIYSSVYPWKCFRRRWMWVRRMRRWRWRW
jgi:hypothetical protein